MRRTIIIIALLTVLTVAALAMATSAQTPPPSSGDWVITDSTTYANQQISVSGDVLVTGNGHLSLTNVNLRFTGGGTHEIRVSNNARLTVSSGTMTAASGGEFGVTLAGNSAIDGTSLTQTSGISISSWKVKISNCTITSSSGNGIYANPTDTYSRALQLYDNKVFNSTDYGIQIVVGNYGNTDVKVNCESNNVSGSLRTGIQVSSTTDKARFILKGNELYRNGGHGLYGNLNVRVVEFRLDDVWAKNNTNDGIRMEVSCSIHHMKFLNDVTSIGNGGEGVYISFPVVHWDRPVFRRWWIYDNDGGGIHFREFNCATLEDSFNVNDRAQADYTTVNTNLEIYRTTHRKGNARVTGGAYLITSYRYIDAYAKWQNGIPCRYNTIQFEDTGGNVLFTRTTDYNGYLDNRTEWDWRVRETRSTLRHSITPYMVGGSQRLTGPTIEFDHDIKEDLLFHDIQTPDLTVDSPSTNHIQNIDNLTIDGRCLDAHSGVAVIQFSFDPEPQWSKKIWRDAYGTTDWFYNFDPAPDDIYTIFVRAFDNANWPNGMFANVTITNVTVDTSAPNLTIINPATDIITNQSQLTVLGTTDPDVISLTLNGEGLAFFGGTFNKAIQLNEGINNIVIIASDYAGNYANATRRIVLDSIPPIMVVRHPPDELYTNQSTETMAGITDRNGVIMTVDGEPVDIRTDGTWTHDVSLLKGWNFILIDAVDIALNHRVITHKIYYDPDPPRITISNPGVNQVVNSSIISIQGSTDPDVISQQIRVNEIWIGMNNSVFDAQITILEEGPTELVFYAMDRAGNSNTVTVPIFIDTTPPVIEDLLPIDGEIVADWFINVTGITEEDATLYIDGSFVTIVDGAFSERIELDEGDNYLIIRVTDTAGNTRHLDRLVVLDTMPPEIFVDGLVGEEMSTDQNFMTITGNTEPTAKLHISYYNTKGGTPVEETIPVSADGEWSYPVIVGKNESTTVLLSSTDYAGNEKVEPFIIKRKTEEEPSFYEANTNIVWGAIIVIAVLLVAFPLTRIGMDRSYERRLKVMGYASQPQYPPPAAPPPPPPPSGPPRGPPGPPPAGRRPAGPPPGGKPPGGPPPAGRPPAKAPPRPPSDEEGGAAPAPRPPRQNE
jgi:hypothetical protein